MDIVSRSRYAMTAQRHLSLEVLQQFGPLAADRIPRVAPVTAEQLHGILRDLEEEGAIRFGWDPLVPGRRRASLTEHGAAVLRNGAAAEPAGAARAR